MSRLTLLSAACALAFGLASPVVAQTSGQTSAPASGGQAAGLRYLAWPGKPAQAPLQPVEGLRPAQVVSARGRGAIIPRVVAGDPPPTAPLAVRSPLPPARPSLTPASDWLRPEPQPAAAAPLMAVSEPAPWVPPPPLAQPGAMAGPVDAHAPRRDAPIFRLQPAEASAPAAGASQGAARPAGEGARYYSLHRQAGRQPDPAPQPQPVYLDGLPVELIQPPASSDLAQPPEPPTLIRNAQGRLQAAPASLADDLP